MGEGSDALMRDENDTTTDAPTPETAEIRANIEAYFARLETRAAAHFF